jgi:MYXO-CTERM domain-containing protein
VQSSYGLYSVTADVAPVPEPGTMALGLAGVGVIGFLLRRRRHG